MIDKAGASNNVAKVYIYIRDWY